jgi:HD-like signal output (HDOD) protein
MLKGVEFQAAQMNSNAAHAEHAATATVLLRAQIAGGRWELPLLPGVAAEVLASSVEDQSDAARLAALIQQDLSLATHVLRVVNSPAFRGASEIVALQQAIARLGMERIREIALSASLKGVLFCGGPYQQRADRAWQVALASALWAKEVARATRRNVEVAYLCGLLRNIGIPVLLHRLGQIAPHLDPQSVASVLDRLAAVAGERLARSWSLPAPVVAVIVHGDDFSSAGDHSDAVAVASCGAALGHWMCERSILIADVVKLAAVAHLDLYPDDVEALLEQQESIRAAMESMVL